MRTDTTAQHARRRREARIRARPRRRRRGRGGGDDPRRRHRDRGHRLGRRVGDHRRVGAGHPRGRRRPQRGHRRHQGPLRPDRGRDHPGARQVLPRPDDRPGRGGRAAQDAERDRARHPPRRPHPDLRHRRRLAAPLRPVRRHAALRDHSDRPPRRADPDHDRGAALGDRDRRHGPPRPPQRARPLRPRGRGLRRLRRPPPRQDRDDHPRQPRGDRVHPDAGRHRGRAGRGGADVLARRRDPRGALDRRPRQGLRHPRARLRRPRADLRPLHRADPDERRRLQRHAAAQGRRRRDRGLGLRGGRAGALRAAGRAGPDRPRGRHPSRRRSQRAGARRHLPQRHRQGRDESPLRPAPRDGHPHDHGHRRQQTHRREDRRRGRRRRLPRRSDPGAKARADQGAAVRRAPDRDDRRRHQRRPGPGPGRRRRGDEHRHPGRARGRQHGRPRLQPHEADRDRRGRQAAADHPRRPHHVLDRQRRRQVLRDPAGDVRDDLGRGGPHTGRSTPST